MFPRLSCAILSSTLSQPPRARRWSPRSGTPEVRKASRYRRSLCGLAALYRTDLHARRPVHRPTQSMRLTGLANRTAHTKGTGQILTPEYLLFVRCFAGRACATVGAVQSPQPLLEP